jgi:imidazoleglycerol phosphate dehydratase HisB
VNTQGYESLARVLQEAYEQAASGKGAERHGQALPFDEQPMQKLIELYGTGFALGQAGKKMQEAQRMRKEPAVRELLGAINYIAGAVIHLERQP